MRIYFLNLIRKCVAPPHIVFVDLFACFPWDSRKLVRGTFSILMHMRNNHALSKKMLWSLESFKLFIRGLREGWDHQKVIVERYQSIHGILSSSSSSWWKHTVRYLNHLEETSALFFDFSNYTCHFLFNLCRSYAPSLSGHIYDFRERAIYAMKSNVQSWVKCTKVSKTPVWRASRKKQRASK